LSATSIRKGILIVMNLLEMPLRTRRLPAVPLFAVQGADSRWLVYFEDADDRATMLLFTSEESASRYINACPDLLDGPGYSLVPLCRDRPQLLQLARRARQRGVDAFQIDRMPCGDCWLQIDLERVLADARSD
jgi:hypothetical protein